jgi:hypothetical protein
MQLHWQGASSITARKEYTLVSPAKVRLAQTVNYLLFPRTMSNPDNTLSRQSNCELLNCLLHTTLNQDLATGFSPEVKLSSAPGGRESWGARDPFHLIVCGDSHMRRVCPFSRGWQNQGH